MKAGWQVKTLGEVCEVVNGGTPKTGVKEYWGNEHLWITPAEMGKRLSPYADDTARKITSQGLRDSSARLLPPNSVILSSRAPIGHLVINTKPMATNQGCKGLVPSEGLAYKYLFYFLQANVDLLNDLGSGATFKELSGGKLKEVKMPLAPLIEQQRIVAILDQTFEGIAKARANAEQNLQNARALFESHLQSVFIKRGEGWVETTLGEICDIIGGGTPSKAIASYFKGDIFWATVRDMKCELLEDTEFKITTEAVKNSSTNIIPKENVVIATRVGLGKVCLLKNDTAVNQDLRGIVPKKLNTVNVNFLFYWFKSNSQKIIDEGTGATVQGVKLPFIKSLTINLPQFSEQAKISENLINFTKETQCLETLYLRKIALLDELKKSLLQQAFADEL